MSYKTIFDEEMKKWLDEIFAGAQYVPSLELNEEDYYTLKIAMKKHLGRRKDTKIMIEEKRKYTNKNNAKADELTFTLDCGMFYVSREILKRIRMIAEAGCRMGLRDTDSTSFILAFHEIRRIQRAIMRDEREDNYILGNLSRRITQLMRENESIRRDMNLIKEIVKSQKNTDICVQSETAFLVRKSLEYDYMALKLLQQLEDDNFHPELYHRRLQQRAKEIKELETTVKQLTSHLDSYMALPPCEALAVFKIKEGEAKLVVLNEEIQSILDNF